MRFLCLFLFFNIAYSQQNVRYAKIDLFDNPYCWGLLNDSFGRYVINIKALDNDIYMLIDTKNDRRRETECSNVHACFKFQIERQFHIGVVMRRQDTCFVVIETFVVRIIPVVIFVIQYVDTEEIRAVDTEIIHSPTARHLWHRAHHVQPAKPPVAGSGRAAGKTLLPLRVQHHHSAQRAPGRSPQPRHARPGLRPQSQRQHRLSGTGRRSHRPL